MSWNLIEAQPRDARGRVALTKRQRCIATAISTLTRQHGYPPTVRELATVCELSGPNAVKQQLNLMRRKGWVTWQDGKAHTLRVVGE